MIETMPHTTPIAVVYTSMRIETDEAFCFYISGYSEHWFAKTHTRIDREKMVFCAPRWMFQKNASLRDLCVDSGRCVDPYDAKLRLV